MKTLEANWKKNGVSKLKYQSSKQIEKNTWRKTQEQIERKLIKQIKLRKETEKNAANNLKGKAWSKLKETASNNLKENAGSQLKEKKSKQIERKTQETNWQKRSKQIERKKLYANWKKTQ